MAKQFVMVIYVLSVIISSLIVAAQSQNKRIKMYYVCKSDSQCQTSRNFYCISRKCDCNFGLIRVFSKTIGDDVCAPFSCTNTTECVQHFSHTICQQSTQKCVCDSKAEFNEQAQACKMPPMVVHSGAQAAITAPISTKQPDFHHRNSWNRLLNDCWKFLGILVFCMAIMAIYLIWVINTSDKDDSLDFNMTTFWPLGPAMQQSGHDDLVTKEDSSMEDSDFGQTKPKELETNIDLA